MDDRHRMAALFAGLADPIRLTILHHLIANPRATNTQICESCHVSQTSATYHLAKLTAAGLLIREKQGSYAHYTATERAITLLRCLGLGRVLLS